MKSNIGGILCLGASLVGSASMASAFSMGGSFQQNLPMIGTRVRPLPRYDTKTFMSTESSRVISEDVKMVVKDLREEDIKEYLSQDGQVKMDVKSAVG